MKTFLTDVVLPVVVFALAIVVFSSILSTCQSSELDQAEKACLARGIAAAKVDVDGNWYCIYNGAAMGIAKEPK